MPAAIKMRLISIVSIGAVFSATVVGVTSKQITASYGIAAIACLVVGFVTTPRIAFTEVPIQRLLIVLWLPLVLCVFVTTGFLLGKGPAVSWAEVGLCYIAGSRAANLRQLLREPA